MGELRQKFEALPLIYQLMDDSFVFVEATQEYTRKNHTEHRLVIATVNGSWYAFKEQQSKIEQLEKLLDQMKHINDEQSKNLANAFKTIEIQQKFDADSQGAIECLTEMNKRYLGEMQEQQDVVANLKDTMSRIADELEYPKATWDEVYLCSIKALRGECE